MKYFLQIAALCSVGIAFFAGCGPSKPGALTSTEAKAFDQAPPEAKQMWTTAVEATRTNDYVGAQTLLFNLLNQPLSPDQKAAVSKQLGALNDQMYAALANGDPNAQKAMEELRRHPPNRPQ